MTFDRSQELDFLNSLVADYKDQSPYSRIKKDIIQNLILKSTSNRQSIKVLQQGCSNGYESDFLVKNFGDVTIVDGSSLFIDRLQKSNSNKSVNLTDLTENDLRHGHRRVYSSSTLREEEASAGFEIVQMKGVVVKILADFQLNELLTDGFLTHEHTRAMQQPAEKPENFELSDSLFVQLKAS